MCITSVYAVMGILYIMPLVLQIHCDDVDFWMLHKKGMLDLQIKQKIYPPKITVLFGTLPSTEERSVIIHFTGCSRKLNKAIILTPQDATPQQTEGVGGGKQTAPSPQQTKGVGEGVKIMSCIHSCMNDFSFELLHVIQPGMSRLP